MTTRAETQEATLTGVTMTLTYEAAPRTDVGDPFYTETTTIAEDTGSTSESEFSDTVSIADVLSKQERLEEEFGDGVIVTVSLDSTAEYEYEDHEGTVRESVVRSGGLITSVGNMYSLPSETSRDTQITGGGSTPDDAAADTINTLAVLAIIGGATGLIGILVVRLRADTAAIAWAIKKRRFQEWVTEVESYTPQRAMNTVSVTSLVDLVNLAIDSKRRVLYHRAEDEYLVVDDRTLSDSLPKKTNVTRWRRYWARIRTVLGRSRHHRRITTLSRMIRKRSLRRDSPTVG